MAISRIISQQGVSVRMLSEGVQWASTGMSLQASVYVRAWAMQRCDLVIDDAPGVGDHSVAVTSKGMVAGAGCCKGVAHHLAVALLVGHQLLAYVIGCQRG